MSISKFRWPRTGGPSGKGSAASGSAPIPIAFVAILAAQFSATVLAQAIPDAGSLIQQIERGRQSALPPKAQPARPAEPAAMPARAGIIVTVKAFRFVGNTLLDASQLAPVVAAFLDRPLDFNGLNQA